MAAPILLPPLIQKIILDPSGVKGGAGAYTQSMGKVGKTTGQVSNQLATAGGSMNTLAFRAQTAGRTLLKGFALPLLGIGALAVKSFASFENSMVRIESLVGVSTGGVNRFTEAVKAASIETGRGPQELAEAMFFIASAGLRGATAMDVLGASAKAAALGLGQTKVVADAATSAVNAYGAENLSGGAAVDVLTAAVREGKVEANRLAPAIGKAIPVASAMGIQFHEVAAAIAAMTRTGTDARTSAIQLRQIMQSLLDPSRQATAAMKEMGIAEGELRRQAEEEGLLSVLKRLRDLAAENADTFADVFPNIRALAGALDITGANLQENEQIFASLANSVGDTDEAFQKYQQTVQFQVTEAMAELKVAVIDMGEAFRPLVKAFTVAVGVVAALTKAMSNTKFGMAAASMGVLAVVVAGLTIALAKFIQMTAASSVALAVQAGAATKSATALMFLSKTMGKTPWLLAIGMAFALGSALFGLGKSAKKPVEELGELRGEIKDIKTVGEISIKPIMDFADAVRDLGAATEELAIAENFFTAYGELIEKAMEMKGGDAAGAVVGGESLLRMFAGQGDTKAVRGAISAIEDQLKGELGDDFFSRLFMGTNSQGASVFLEDEFTKFLTGEDPKATADRLIGVYAESVLGSARTVVRDAIDKTGAMRDSAESQGLIPGDWIVGAIELRTDELEKGFVEQASEINKLLKTGNLPEAIALYNGLIGKLGEDMGTGPDALTGREHEAAVAVITDSLMDAMSTADLFKDDFDQGMTSIHDMLTLINSEGIDVFKHSDFAGAQNYVLLAEQYELSLMGVTAENERLNEAMPDWQVEALALERAAAAVLRLNKAQAATADQQKGLGKVADVIAQFETGFAKADAAAKKLDSRFDDFIGRAISMKEAQLDFNDSLVGMAEAILENDGALSSNTQGGRDATRAILEQVGAIRDVGVAMLEQGHDADTANDAMQTYLASLIATAREAGVSKGQLDALLVDANVNVDTLAFGTLDEKATDASQQIHDIAAAVQNQTGPFVFDQGLGIGANLMEGVAQGLITKKREIIGKTNNVLEDLVKAVKHELGISSPSTVFRDEVGVAMAQGLVEGFTKKLVDDTKIARNAIRDFVDEAIGITNNQVSSASRAISAVIDLEDAQAALLKTMRDTTNMETGGAISRRESLTGRQLQHRVEEAQRALRLGQGHQFDLEMALLNAQEALTDFETNVESGSPVAKAQLNLMDAAQEAANAEAQMRMEGEAAITAFTNMAEAVGLAGSALTLLTTVDEEEMNVFEKIFSQEVQDAIANVAAGIGLINDELEEVSNSDAAEDIVEETAVGGLRSLVPGQEGYNLTTNEAFQYANQHNQHAMGRASGPEWQQWYQQDNPNTRPGWAQFSGGPPDTAAQQDLAGLGGGYPESREGVTTGPITIQELNVAVTNASAVGSAVLGTIHDSIMGRETGTGLGGPPNTR